MKIRKYFAPNLSGGLGSKTCKLNCDWLNLAHAGHRSYLAAEDLTNFHKKGNITVILHYPVNDNLSLRTDHITTTNSNIVQHLCNILNHEPYH